MNSGSRHIKAIFFCLLLCAFSEAQVSIRASVDRDKILIGEAVTLTVEAYFPIGVAVAWFQSDSIPHFQIISASPIDTIQNIDAKKFIQSFVLTSFDSGQQYVPPFRIAVDGQQFFSDSIAIDVSFTPFDPKEDYRDIKDIIDIRNPSLKYVQFALMAVLLVSIAALTLAWYKRKFLAEPSKKTVVPALSPYEEAMQALAQLGHKQLTNGEVKKYYSAMNDILRKYVARKFTISTFEKTNEELIMELSGLGIPKDAFIRLTQSLRMSDFVKFARYRPNEEENRNNLQVVSSSIEIMDKNFAGAV